MPAPRHCRLSWRGIWGTTAQAVEEWSMGLSSIITPTDEPSLAELGQIATALIVPWQTHLAGQLSSAARLTEVEIAVVGSNGKYERTASGAYKRGLAAADASSSGTENHPLQVSLAVSLTTSMDGPTGRGRFYLPTPTLGTLTRGRISTTRQTDLANSCENFVSAVNDVMDGPGWTATYGVVCVASGGSATRNLAPALHPVNGVAVGLAVDTQRRRRGDLAEEKVRVPLG